MFTLIVFLCINNHYFKIVNDKIIKCMVLVVCLCAETEEADWSR